MEILEYKQGNDESIEIKENPVAVDTYFLVDPEGKVWRVLHSTLIAALSPFDNLIEDGDNVKNADTSVSAVFEWGKLKLQENRIFTNDASEGLSIEDESDVAQITMKSITSQRLILRLSGNIAEIKGAIAQNQLTIKTFSFLDVQMPLVAQTVGMKKGDEPADPQNGQSAMWQSNGNGQGDAGDIMIKITEGDVTKTATLVDFSAI